MLSKTVKWCLASGLVTLPMLAQSVRALPEKKLWVLEGDQVTYVLGLNERKELQHVYWGKRLYRDADLAAAHSYPEWASFDLPTTTTPQEYPAWGAGLYVEPCLKATFANGNRDVELVYASDHIDGNTLTIELKDIRVNLTASLKYTIEPVTGIIRKQSTIRNQTGQTVVLESAQSAAWYLPRGDGYRLSYLTGRWAGETQLQRDEIRPGMQVLESRRGSTSQQANPWFAIAPGRPSR